LELSAEKAPFPHLRAGAGAAVLLVPGLGGRTDFWSAQIPRLAEYWTVITWDQRGVGARAGEVACSAPAELATDVATMLDELRGLPVALVGHSMGAGICQHFALNAADRLQGMVLSSAWAKPLDSFRALIAERREILQSQGPAAYLAVSARIALPASAESSIDDDALAERAAGLNIEDELARLDALYAHDLSTQVGEIRLPVEVLAAADDRLTPPTMSEDLAARLPRAQLTMLESGGHMAPQANAEEFSSALIRSLERLLPAHH
jgi:aminoacrylate hydrolase